MEELVSVVVPIYNVEKYLDRCMNSLVNQTYTNLEIILIDDGSTDSCPEICEKWARKDSRVKVIHKANAGLGMARNSGIENASGKYICFFDSDDYVDLTTVEKAHFAAKEHEADIVVFGMSNVDKTGNVTKTLVPQAEKDCYCAEEVLNRFLPGIMRSDGTVDKIKNVRFSAWSCLFSTELIKRSNWRFVSEREIISEDVYSLLALYNYVERAAFLREALYFYCENDTSLTHSYREDRFERNKYFYKKCIELCRENNYPLSVEKSCMPSFLGNTVAAMKQITAFYEKSSDAIKVLRQIIDDDLLQDVIKEKMTDSLSFKVRALFWTIVHKKYRLCYTLLSSQKLKRSIFFLKDSRGNR